MTHVPAALCPHGDRAHRCATCSLAELRRAVRDLDRAVSGLRDKAPGTDFVRGGAPSWEPINMSALALLQDIQRAGGLDHVEYRLHTESIPSYLADLERSVRSWRARAALILGNALAPYPLLWPDSSAILCPVINEHGECGGRLRVHREQDPTKADYGRPVLIQCAARDDHEWTMRHGGWMRLGVLLGGAA